MFKYALIFMSPSYFFFGGHMKGIEDDAIQNRLKLHFLAIDI
jgi:hypothetical protein